ncbi:NAD-dependent epimerase/dehydratase family protein [Rhodococcus sp. NPDC003383]
MGVNRVLVTGGSGFIGSHLCRRLADSGPEVHAVSRTRRNATDGVRWWTTDLTDHEATRQLLRTVRPEMVFHLASYVTGSRDLGAVLPTFRANLLTTVNLLTAACEVDRPLVVLAGSAEEPPPRDPDPVPASPYAAAKVAASTYARTFSARFGLPTFTFRISMVYGPGQQDGTKLVPYVTQSLLRGESPALSSGGREVDWVYVDDVVDAFVMFADSSETAHSSETVGESLDIGSGQLVSVRSVVERIAQMIDGPAAPRFGVLDDRPFERTLLADVARTRAAIGWEPRTGLEIGLTKTVEWFRQDC